MRDEQLSDEELWDKYNGPDSKQDDFMPELPYARGGPLHNMTDCPDAKRLVLMWVPTRFSRWKKVSWGLCLGRLWIQWTPDFNNTLDTPKKRG